MKAGRVWCHRSLAQLFGTSAWQRGLAQVLGFERLEHYRLHSPYFGAVVGRPVGRVAGGHVMIDGRAPQLSLNEMDEIIGYGRNAGCCLEPQLFPDSANHLDLQLCCAQADPALPPDNPLYLLASIASDTFDSPRNKAGCGPVLPGGGP